jgi:hypothetical protein
LQQQHRHHHAGQHHHHHLHDLADARAALGALDEAGLVGGIVVVLRLCVPASGHRRGLSYPPATSCNTGSSSMRKTAATSGGAAISSDSADERRSAPLSGASSSGVIRRAALFFRTCLVHRRSRFEVRAEVGE